MIADTEQYQESALESFLFLSSNLQAYNTEYYEQTHTHTHPLCFGTMSVCLSWCLAMLVCLSYLCVEYGPALRIVSFQGPRPIGQALPVHAICEGKETRSKGRRHITSCSI